jgi:hypothetical protein
MYFNPQGETGHDVLLVQWALASRQQRRKACVRTGLVFA